MRKISLFVTFPDFNLYMYMHVYLGLDRYDLYVNLFNETNRRIIKFNPISPEINTTIYHPIFKLANDLF